MAVVRGPFFRKVVIGRIRSIGQGKAGSECTALTNEKAGRATGSSANHPRFRKNTQVKVKANRAALDSRFHWLKIQTK
jgi:hypothetical protein